MTQLKLSAPWEEVKEKIKESNAEITDDDLEYTPGQEDLLLNSLSKKLNLSVAEVKAWIESVSFNKGIAS